MRHCVRHDLNDCFPHFNLVKFKSKVTQPTASFRVNDELLSHAKQKDSALNHSSQSRAILISPQHICLDAAHAVMFLHDPDGIFDRFLLRHKTAVCPEQGSEQTSDYSATQKLHSSHKSTRNIPVQVEVRVIHNVEVAVGVGALRGRAEGRPGQARGDAGVEAGAVVFVTSCGTCYNVHNGCKGRGSSGARCINGGEEPPFKRWPTDFHPNAATDLWGCCSRTASRHCRRSATIARIWDNLKRRGSTVFANNRCA